jgi:hypothetical protein
MFLQSLSGSVVFYSIRHVKRAPFLENDGLYGDSHELLPDHTPIEAFYERPQFAALQAQFCARRPN